ncbi:Uncharacterised protein [Serratia fonticola]|uniref:Uncharacterized protein n=1 Tax=Serratia fonticola TaxID=47917 RepID=A0A4U9WQJ9_SERFO|nr:Uncharacterised protein [Serratia fonticola]
MLLSVRLQPMQQDQTSQSGSQCGCLLEFEIFHQGADGRAIIRNKYQSLPRGRLLQTSSARLMGIATGQTAKLGSNKVWRATYAGSSCKMPCCISRNGCRHSQQRLWIGSIVTTPFLILYEFRVVQNTTAWKATE